MLPRRITITLFTLVNLKNRQNLDALLDVFEQFSALRPHKWKKDDIAKPKELYDRHVLTETVGICWDMDTPMLYGSKGIPYESYFGFESNRQHPNMKRLNGLYWDLDVPPKFQKVDLIFEFSRRLADVIQPEHGCIDFVCYDSKASELYSPGIKRQEFQENGVPSLGIRTWMGQHVTNQIGLERLKSCGAVFCETSWGGVELDLVEQPWLADFDTLLQAKQRIMPHLEPSGVFGDYSKYPLPLYTPAPNWVPIPLECR
jgi:hypothetical protein